MSEQLLEWLFNQGPALVVTMLFLGYVIWTTKNEKQLSLATSKEKDDKIDKILSEKDESLNRFYNALTEWKPVLHESVKNLESNTTEMRKGTGETREQLNLVLKELNSIKLELDHLKEKLV